tara:strand:+ start:648 stop:959 length:312 start_codon:yes stop_codon:yes gene_type:complete
MTNNLNLVERARDAALNGFTLRNALGEAVGYASLYWKTTPEGEFDSSAASALVTELEAAIAKFVQIAINQQSIDAQADMADWELVELIFQAPAMGIEPEGQGA